MYHGLLQNLVNTGDGQSPTVPRVIHHDLLVVLSTTLAAMLASGQHQSDQDGYAVVGECHRSLRGRLVHLLNVKERIVRLITDDNGLRPSVLHFLFSFRIPNLCSSGNFLQIIVTRPEPFESNR